MYKFRFPANNVDETTPDSACFHVIVIVCFLKIVPLVLVQSVYKRTYIKSAVELCGSILFLTELCQAVEAGKLDIIDVK
jgi:hypothetical protein